MKLRFKPNVFFGLFVPLMISLTALQAQDPEQSGQIIAIRGRNNEIQRGQETLQPRVRDRVYKNDLIRTGNRGRMQVRFPDKSIISLGSNTEVLLESYMYDKEKSDGEVIINVQEGIFRVMGGAITKVAPDKFKTKTATATIGIRGSMFAGSYRQQRLVAVFLAGKGIYVTNEEGRVELDVPSLFTEVTPGKKPEKPKAVAPELLNSLLDETVVGGESGEDKEDGGSVEPEEGEEESTEEGGEAEDTDDKGGDAGDESDGEGTGDESDGEGAGDETGDQQKTGGEEEEADKPEEQVKKQLEEKREDVRKRLEAKVSGEEDKPETLEDLVGLFVEDEQQGTVDDTGTDDPTLEEVIDASNEQTVEEQLQNLDEPIVFNGYAIGLDTMGNTMKNRDDTKGVFSLVPAEMAFGGQVTLFHAIDFGSTSTSTARDVAPPVFPGEDPDVKLGGDVRLDFLKKIGLHEGVFLDVNLNKPLQEEDHITGEGDAILTGAYYKEASTDSRPYLLWGAWNADYKNPADLLATGGQVFGSWIVGKPTSDAAIRELAGSSDFSGSYSGTAQVLVNGSFPMSGTSTVSVDFAEKRFDSVFDFSANEGPRMQGQGGLENGEFINGHFNKVSQFGRDLQMGDRNEINGRLFGAKAEAVGGIYEVEAESQVFQGTFNGKRDILNETDTTNTSTNLDQSTTIEE